MTQPAHGTLALAADGSFTYTPASGFVGQDSFTYKANDGSLDSNVATVTISVLDTKPPTCSFVNGGAVPLSDAFVGIPAAESTLEIAHGRPGFTRIDVTVNGAVFRIRGLHNREQRTVDLARAMRPGTQNAIAFRGYGRRGATASVLLHD